MSMKLDNLKLTYSGSTDVIARPKNVVWKHTDHFGSKIITKHVLRFWFDRWTQKEPTHVSELGGGLTYFLCSPLFREDF